jgi:DNA-binding MarR family transcriptional regulator
MATISSTSQELPARLRLAITRLARRLRQQSEGGLSPSQTAALASVERHAGLTPSELASIERIQRPTATRVLRALEESGLVTRERDEADARSTRVRVTREGAALLKRSRTRKNAYLAKRLRTLDPEDLEALERAAGVLERLLDEEAPR